MDEYNFDKELFGQFLNLLQETQKGIDKHPDFSYIKNNHHLFSDRGKYVQKVFRYYSRVMEVQEDLDRIAIFLRRFPLKKFYEENNIDYISYTKYHMEVFFHKINTLLDLLKLMVNEVYELNLSARKCTWDKLCKHDRTKDTPPLKVMEYYHKSFEHIIKARNLNTHRGLYHDPESDDIRMPMMIYRESEKFNIDVGEDLRLVMPKFGIEYRLRKFKKEKLNYIKNANEVVTQYVNLFMNVTLPVVIQTALKKQH